MVDRRAFSALVVFGFFGPVIASATAWSTDKPRGGKRVRRFPAFEIEAPANALALLETGIREYSTVAVGRGVSLVWLKDNNGDVWVVGVDQRDLEFKFEVFTLAIDTLEMLQERTRTWTPPKLSPDIPENMRAILSMRPQPPSAPNDFRPWPLANWKVQVLRRTEFIVEEVQTGPTFGNNPNAQSATKPGTVPPEASASCEVAAGLLFSSGQQSLLLAVDWMPFDMIVSEDHTTIERFIAGCEIVSLRDYMPRARAPKS